LGVHVLKTGIYFSITLTIVLSSSLGCNLGYLLATVFENVETGF